MMFQLNDSSPHSATPYFYGTGRHQGAELEVVDCPSTRSGEAVLPGLTLDLTEVWT
jgi:hypothetical protein